jgi:predicted MFS family arabinose efflux permease
MQVAPTLRATALGAVFAGFHSGNLLGLALSPLIVQALGWRALFYAFGVLGGPLVLLWALVVPERARRAQAAQSGGGMEGAASPQRRGAPAEGGAGVGLGDLLSSTAVWAIIVANFVNHWGYFMYLNWMPTYFYKVLGGWQGGGWVAGQAGAYA